MYLLHAGSGWWVLSAHSSTQFVPYIVDVEAGVLILIGTLLRLCSKDEKRSSSVSLDLRVVRLNIRVETLKKNLKPLFPEDGSAVDHPAAEFCQCLILAWKTELLHRGRFHRA